MGRERGKGPSKKDGWIQQKIQKLMIGWGEYYLELESNYLIVSLVLLKFLRWQQHHFCLFQLVLVCLWLYYAATGVFILLCPQEKELHSSSWGHRYTHSAAQSSKRFKHLSVTLLLWQSHWWSSTWKFLLTFDFR